MPNLDDHNIAWRTEPDAARPATESEVRAALALAERMQLTGIGGWLATFYILYGFGWFFGIGLLVGMSNANQYDTGGTFMVLADWAGRIVMGLCMFTAHNSKSGPMRAGLIVQIICAATQLMILLGGSNHDKGTFALLILLYMAYSGGWLIYFKKSLRVKYTYDHNLRA